MSSKINVGVLFGGRSGEHDVSVMSARSVLNALNPEKYNITQIAITRQGEWLVGENLNELLSNAKTDLEKQRAAMLPFPGSSLYVIDEGQANILQELTKLDVVFPVLHGTFGEDGTLQGFFELADIAYVGAGVLGSAAGMDKGLFKDVMVANDIPVLDWVVLTRNEIRSDQDAVVRKLESSFQYPVFVKPANLGSSVGITKCSSRSDILEGLLEAAQYDRRIVVEQGLDAREIEISVLGNEDPEASVPGEVIPSRDFYSYESKYIDGTSGLLIPAPLPHQTIERIVELAFRAYKAIDCAGMARVDFLLDKDAPIKDQAGGLYMNEVNTIPGFTEISMYPKLWQASGLSYPELVNRLIELALERKADRDQTLRVYGGGQPL